MNVCLGDKEEINMRDYLLIVHIFLIISLSCEKNCDYSYKLSGVKSGKKQIFKRKNLSIDSSHYLFKKIDSISLEATEKSFLTEIRNIFMNDSLIIVVDKNNPVPLVFDRAGKFLYQLSRIGDGPGETKYNCCTQLINDSIIGIYNSSSLSIELFDLKKRKKTEEISISKKGIYSSQFLTPEGKYYYFFNPNPIEPSKGFIHYYDKEKDSLIYLWGMDQNYISNYKNYQNLVFCHLSDCVFSSLNTDYKIHFWNKGLYKGYLTNEYYDYHFIPCNRTTKFNDLLAEYDMIKQIFILDTNLLFVVLMTKEGQTVSFEYKGKICYTKKYFERIDIFHTEKKEIYPALINSFHKISGIYKDRILVVKEYHSSDYEKIDLNHIKNPSILVYQIKKEIFNEK